MTRLSVWLETANAIREGTFALIIPVITSTEGRCGEDEVDADCAGLLRQADDRVLDLLRRDHQEVRELVDDDEEIRQRVLAAAGQHLVQLGQVPRAGERHALVAAVHLAEHVGEDGRGRLRARDDRGQEVRD